MPRFRYRALRQTGGEIEGELVAEDQRAAVLHLQATGSFPIEVAPTAARPAQARRWLRGGARLPARDLVLFTRQLAALLGSGVAVERALALVGATRTESRRAALADALLAAIRRGESLSRACADSPSFPRHYATVIAAGEASGDLAGALDRLASVLERNRAIGQALADALVYPASVAVVAVLSIAFLLGFVVPRFATLLESFRQEPPLAMRILLGASGLFQDYGLPAAIVAALLAALYLLGRRDAAFRAAVDRGLLAIPALGPFLGRIEAERLAFLLGTMAAAGVSLPAAILAAREATANEALRAGLDAAARGVERGDSLAAALAAARLLPELALELVRVGEETGDLPPLLLKASDVLRRETEATTTRWIGLAAPISMVALGLLIGAIALALFGTILEVYDIAS